MPKIKRILIKLTPEQINNFSALCIARGLDSTKLSSMKDLLYMLHLEKNHPAKFPRALDQKLSDLK